MLEAIKRLLRSWFGLEIKVEPVKRETTKHFEDFKIFYALEHPDVRESEENLLCIYTTLTLRSPYANDKDFTQAKELLRRNGIDPVKVWESS